MHDPTPLVFGAFLLGSGALFALYPYRLARFSEQLDAIGSTTRLSEVEPAGWKVSLNRIGGVTCALVGALVLVLGILN